MLVRKKKIGTIKFVGPKFEIMKYASQMDYLSRE